MNTKTLLKLSRQIEEAQFYLDGGTPSREIAKIIKDTAQVVVSQRLENLKDQLRAEGLNIVDEEV